MFFWDKYALSGRDALVVQDALAVLECSFGRQMPFWAATAPSGRKVPFGTQIKISHSRHCGTFSTDTHLCALGLINQTESAAIMVCHGVRHGLLTAKITVSQ